MQFVVNKNEFLLIVVIDGPSVLINSDCILELEFMKVIIGLNTSESWQGSTEFLHDTILVILP